MHSKTRHCKLHIWWFRGGVGVEMHASAIFPCLVFSAKTQCQKGIQNKSIPYVSFNSSLLSKKLLYMTFAFIHIKTIDQGTYTKVQTYLLDPCANLIGSCWSSNILVCYSLARMVYIKQAYLCFYDQIEML